MNIYVLVKGPHQENHAKWIIKDQMLILLEYLKMKQKFDVYYGKINNIKEQFKRILTLKNFRLAMLDQMFDREKKIMVSPNRDHAKKMEKFTAEMPNRIGNA